MKKLVALSAFIVLGFAAAYAQSPSQKAPAAPAPAASVQAVAPVAVDAVNADAVGVEVKKEGRKECSTEEKKACGTKAGKKSCCSSKAEAKKEDGK
jgi:hypothetical protein